MAEVASDARVAATDALSGVRERLLSPAAGLVAVLLLTLIVYTPSLGQWFNADDFWLLRSSQETPMGEFVAEAFDFRDTEPVTEFRFYRPLYVTTFRVTYEVFGTDALGYHGLNVALHLMSVTLVWLIMRRLLPSAPLATGAALVFALHPAYAETVTWIARGNTLMATVPYLVSLYCFIRSMDGGRAGPAWFGGSVVSFAVATLYHPNAVSLAAVLPAYVFLFVRRPAEALRAREWLRFLPHAAVAIGIIAIQSWVRREYGLEGAFSFGWHQYGNYGQYLGLALLPLTGDDWLALDITRTELRNIVQGAASMVMIGLTLVLIDRRRWPFVTLLGVWWFYTALAPNSTALLRAIPAQLYLPGVGLALFFALCWRTATDIVEEKRLPWPSRNLAYGAGLGLGVVLIAAITLGVAHQRDTGQNAGENERFIAQLREDLPTIPAGGTLYVVNAPLNLHVFTDHALDALVELHYGEVDAVTIGAVQASEIEGSLGPDERLFRFQPGR